MAQIFKCPCGQALRVGEQHLGRTVKCPRCQKPLRLSVPISSTVPARAAPKPATAPPPKPEPTPNVTQETSMQFFTPNRWILVGVSAALVLVVVLILALSGSDDGPTPPPERLADNSPGFHESSPDEEKDDPRERPRRTEQQNQPQRPTRKQPQPERQVVFQVSRPDLPARLREINVERKRLGLDPVELDNRLCEQCQNQIVNLALNGPMKSPFVSARAAGDEMIPTCMASWKVRAQMLNPHLKKIGLASGTAGGNRVITVLDLTTGMGTVPSFAVLYPMPDQKNVPLAFPGNEIPNPIPKSERLTAGFPITVMFPMGPQVRNTQGTLMLDGREVPVWFSSPEKPANPDHRSHQGATMCLLPKLELEPASTYTVKAAATVNGVKWEKTWSFTTTSRERFGSDLVPAVFRRINEARKSAGTDPLTLDKDMMKVAQDHARYLALNEEAIRKDDIDTHTEDPKRPGYTKQGAELAQYAHVGQAPFDAMTTVESWLGTFHYRIALLEPVIQGVGVGVARGPRMTFLVVLPGPVALKQGAPPKPPSVYPIPNQKNVPTHYETGELPDPIPNNKDRLAGFPISVHFFYGVKVKQVKATLTLDGTAVPFSMSTPEKPVAKDFQRHTVCLIPDKPLQRGSTYQVSIKAMVDGNAWSKDWQFTTGGTAKDLEAQNQRLIDAINRPRREVGLAPVKFDAELSKSCYAHAQYLLRNWGHPAVQGLGIHEERQFLPGYSREGHIAGQASVIATGSPPEDAVEDWMATLFHRIPILNPDLKSVGLGYVKGGEDNWIVVVDTGRGVDAPPILVYPAANQTDVARKEHKKVEGFPISVTFPIGREVGKPGIILRNGFGNRVELQVIEPERLDGITDKPMTLTAIPRSPLQRGMTYTVTADAYLGRRHWVKRWSFTTAK